MTGSPVPTLFFAPPIASADAPRIREKAAEALAFQLAPVAARLERGGWYLGRKWSVLDPYLAWIWFRITDSGFDADSFPAIGEHFSRAMKRPSAKAALAHEKEAEKELQARGLLFRPSFSGPKENNA